MFVKLEHSGHSTTQKGQVQAKQSQGPQLQTVRSGLDLWTTCVEFRRCWAACSLVFSSFEVHMPLAAFCSSLAHMEAGNRRRLWGSLPSLSKAACDLRAPATIAQVEACAGEEWNGIEAFYERLSALENREDDSTWYKPIIVSVEFAGKGDGLLKGLECVGLAHVVPTPPASLRVAKDIFHKIGGVAARAFDVLSNYMAVQECKDVCKEKRQPLVFLIEDFCHSAFCSGVDDDACWCWPPALMKPRLILEAGASPRLSKAMQQLDVEKIGMEMNGLSQKEMLEVIKGKIDKAIFLSTEDLKLMFGENPLRCLVSVARKEGLLAETEEKWQLGKRGEHIPWSFQLATPSRASAAPSLRTVGIHSVTETGFIFFCLGSAGGGSGQPGDVPASMVLLLDSYPFQQQWRAEGVVKEMKWGAPSPPYSLACAMQRCVEIGQREPAASGERVALANQGEVLDRQAGDTREGPSTAYIFIPHRIEVLLGHPPAPGGTRRCEWFRSDTRLWKGPRAVLPFSLPVEMSVVKSKPQKLTVVVMGSHTAGKSTVGAEVAQRLQWQWDSELGTSLRGAQEEMGNYGAAWDETIHKAEVARDQERMSSKTSRVVETWHLGNYVWALTRHPEQEEELRRRALNAILEEQETTRVLLVLLQIDVSTMLRRTKGFETSVLHFKDEEAECLKLSKATGEKLDEIMQEPNELSGITVPIFKWNNNADGQLDDAVSAITDFISFFI